MLLLGVLLPLYGCFPPSANFGYTCKDPDREHVDVNGRPDPCHYRDPVDAGADAQCPEGETVHVPLGWDGPTRLWIGPEDQAPECPHGPAAMSYEGHADLVASSDCDACSCMAPTGSCALPSTLTASTTPCNIPGGSSTSFNAPNPWDGSCDGTIQTPAGAAYSLTIGALTMTGNECAPGVPTSAKVVPAFFKTYARTCEGEEWEPGPISRSLCFSDAEPLPPDFRLCVFHDGERSCPPPANTTFTEQHVFYGGLKDDRQCSECACGPAMGSTCTASISIYKGGDLTCSGPTFAQFPASSEKPACFDIAPPGQALGSKSASLTTYTPGVCQPIGGQHSGEAIGLEPSTFCCRP